VSPHWSRLFADNLRIFMHPQHLVLLRIRRGLKAQVVDKQLIALQTANQDEPWQPALLALKQALAKPGWQGLAPAVVLANHFVRYTVIPWNADLAGAAEQQAYLRHCFQLAYGDTSKQWDLRMSPAGVGQSTLASAIPQALLAGLHTELELAGMKARAIHPHLMIAANQAASQVRERSLCLVAIEGGRVCIALIENGAWRAVRNVTMEQTMLQQIPALIRRESIIQGLDTASWPVFYHWPESDNAEGLLVGESSAQPIETKTWAGHFDHHAYRLAMWHE
jgi:hypothetical protein